MAAPDVEVSPVDSAALASFTRQLGAMLDAGVDVLRALRIASQHSGDSRLLEVTSDVERTLKDGKEFYQAIGRHPEVFDPFYVEMTRQGESDGILGKSLLSVADYLERSSSTPAQPAYGPLGGGAQLPLAQTSMLTLGVLAMGAAAIWGIQAARPELLPLNWLGPIAAFWAGMCLMGGAYILSRLRREGTSQGPSQARPAPARPAPLPPKTQERKAAETQAVVRSALMDQAEEVHAPAEGPAQSQNGKGLIELLEPLDADRDPPRFQM